MPESPRLIAARQRLASAERQFEAPDGLLHLEEGLALLDEICEDGGADRSVAENVAATYAARIFDRVQQAIATDRAVPEPRLQHYFKLMLAFDAGDFALPEQARDAKIAVVRRLLDLMFEGHPAETKQAALARLGEIAGTKQGKQ